MWAVTLAVLPIFLLLVMGNLLRRNGFPGDGFWEMADRVTYWVLFPALLFKATASAPLESNIIGSYAFSLLSAMVVCFVFALLALKFIKHPWPVGTSVLQGAIRNNTFIAFAVAQSVLGAEGILLATVATAVLVPPTNILCVGALVTAHGRSEKIALPLRLVQEIIRNPLLVSIFLGGCFNLAGLGPIPIFNDFLEILSRAALPVALLSVGAGLRIKTIHTAGMAVVISSFSKLVIFPAVLAATLLVSGVTGTAAIVVMLYGAVPTASSGYALARHLGGDAEAMAGIITVQTLLSMATIPVVITLAFSWFG